MATQTINFRGTANTTPQSLATLNGNTDYDDILELRIQSLSTNVEYLWIGDSNVNANSGSERGIPIIGIDRFALFGSRSSDNGPIALSDVYVAAPGTGASFVVIGIRGA